MPQFAIHALKLGPTVLPGVTATSQTWQRETYKPAGAGHLHQRMVSVKRLAPRLTFTTTALVAALDQMLIAGYPFPCQRLSAKNLQGWGIRADPELPAFAGGSSHESLVLATGALLANSLSWSRPGEAANLSLTAHALSTDGQAVPWAVSQVALPALSPVDADWDLESLTLNGETMTGVSNLRFTFGPEASPQFNPGNLYATYLQQAPVSGPAQIMASFSTEDETLFRRNGGFSGDALVDVVAVFRPFQQALAARGAAALTLSLKAACEVPEAQRGRPGTVSVNCHGVSANGTDSPFSATIS